ncbi:proton-conducting transporter membrane subunit [Zavarzinia sp.]|uniref:proton-conducting transporter transmembrane domain-containing protein n=1 Tax=Zavarzinia sp. TaxID=2027920 RepID=UPI0035639FC5
MTEMAHALLGGGLPPGWPLLLAGLIAFAVRSEVIGRLAGIAGLCASLALVPDLAAAANLLPLELALMVTFHLVVGIGILFAGQRPDRIAVAGGLIAGGAALAALAARTLLGFAIWTEVIALASAFIVMAGGTPRALSAGLAYLLLQVTAGVLLLIAAALGQMDAPVVLWLLFAAFCLKVAVPPVHGWLVAAYPAASPTGSLFLAAFATKVAVVSLGAALAGAEPLLWLGLVMAVGAAIPMLFEAHWRRALSWSLVSQLGVMVAGIGLGSPEAMQGVVLLAIGHILYSTLLFLAAGSLEIRDGKAPRGLRVLALLGALSIGLPGLAGYGGKALIGEALIHHHMAWADYVIVVVGALVFAAVGLRPLVERCTPAPGAPWISLREAAATALLVAGSLLVGLFGPLIAPAASVAWHAGPLIVQAIALSLACLTMVPAVRRRWPQWPDALDFLALPKPAWVTGAITGLTVFGEMLSRIGAVASALTAAIGRTGGRLLLATARGLTAGGLGDGVLWALALLTVALIVSFG